MSFERKKLILVDGYNVLRCDRFDEDWTSDLYNKYREELLNDIALKYNNDNETVVIVYDAAKRPSHKKLVSLKEITPGSITTLFTPTGISADTQIEKLAYEAIEKKIQVTIVTSDSVIRNTTANKGVTHIGAQNFKIMLSENNDFCSYNNTSLSNMSLSEKTEHSTIASRIDNNTLKKLKSLRNRI